MIKNEESPLPHIYADIASCTNCHTFATGLHPTVHPTLMPSSGFRYTSCLTPGLDEPLSENMHTGEDIQGKKTLAMWGRRDTIREGTHTEPILHE